MAVHGPEHDHKAVIDFVEAVEESMRFTKMHGIGNDYIYVDCFHEPSPADPADLSRRISDRHFGVGGDGLVLICPPEQPGDDARMRMFNADGSEAQMCGNAIRCVAKYLFDHGHVVKTQMRVQTGRGPLDLQLEIQNQSVARVRVNMMPPILQADAIPTTLPGEPPIDASITIGGKELAVTCISMGNPHAVTFVPALSDDWVLRIGPQLEQATDLFPERVNAEFVEVLSRQAVRMRVWERGSGETWACGTGACAVVVAGVVSNRLDRTVTVHLRGGDLFIEWADDNCVYMTGPATEVFHGEWPNHIP